MLLVYMFILAKSICMLDCQINEWMNELKLKDFKDKASATNTCSFKVLSFNARTLLVSKNKCMRSYKTPIKIDVRTSAHIRVTKNGWYISLIKI